MEEQKLISTWLDLAGYKEGNIPVFPRNKRFQLALSLVLEELLEAAEAGSKEQYKEFLNTAKNFIEAKLDNVENEKTVGDVDELRDACADMRVVMGNLIHFAGLKEMFDEDFEEVMKSNFSKYCIFEEDAIETVRLYAEGTHPNKMGKKIETYYEKVDSFYIIKQKSDGKILKSMYFKEPEFKTLSREKFIQYLEEQESDKGLMSGYYQKNSDQDWTYVKPAVDGMMPSLKVLEDKVIYSQPSLYGDSEPDEEYSFAEMLKKIRSE